MRRYGSRREDNDITKVNGLPEVVHGEKSSRAREARRWLEAIRECTCVHGISVADPCDECDAAFDEDEKRSKTT